MYCPMCGASLAVVGNSGRGYCYDCDPSSMMPEGHTAKGMEKRRKVTNHIRRRRERKKK